MEREIHIFPHLEELEQALALHVLHVAAKSVAARGRFMLALSGGTAMTRLAAGILADKSTTPVDGSAWHVFWADERCVPRNSMDSNSGAASRSWLDRMPIPSRQIYAVDGTRAPADAAQDYVARLTKAFHLAKGEWPQFDLILLGVGNDGHTASLFPDDSALDETMQWVVPVFHAPKPPPERVTLTLPVINHARHVAFVAAGLDKAPILARILQRLNSEKPTLPAQQVQLSNGEIHWFIDQVAASAMDKRRIL